MEGVGAQLDPGAGLAAIQAAESERDGVPERRMPPGHSLRWMAGEATAWVCAVPAVPVVESHFE